MSGRFAILTGLIALLFLSCPAQAAPPTIISAVRLWPAPDYTRLTLESARHVDSNMFTLTHPDRLVIDLSNVKLHGALDGIASKVNVNDPYIKSIRVAQNKPGVVRLVLDLKTAVKPQLFSLDPVAQYGYRLVLDVYPAKPSDPLMALAKKSEQKLSGGGSAPADTDTASISMPHTASTSAGASDTMLPGEHGLHRKLIIVVDAGHGGEDPGAHGRHGTLEKNVTLAIARKLKKLIDATGNMRAVMTRDGDYFVPLGERVDKARKAHADLFVSIHADAYIRRGASGSSVFALSRHGATSAAARWLAKSENKADLIGGVNIAVKDPNLAYTLLDLSQTATISDSLKLGRNVLRQLGDINHLHHDHVEQAGFAVLKAPDIPSILVETAFISNPKEERKLRTTKYQEKLAHAILSGIQHYFAHNPPVARHPTVAEAQ